MKKVSLIIVVVICSTFISRGQVTDQYILSGVVVNGELNSSLVGANIVSSRKIGTKTNETGEFEIQVFPYDTLNISFIGFKTIKYLIPHKEKGKYLIKFKMYRDSISLAEVEIFPWPTYEEFKEAFLAINKENEKIKMEGINMYVDRNTSAPQPTILNPLSFIYDKLFDKQAKIRRRLERRRSTIKNSKFIDE